MRVTLAKSHFWKWFERNNLEYLHLRKKNKKEFSYWINEMSAHLRAYFKYIYFELGWSHDGKNAMLIITADGRSQYFKRVDDLVAKAPSIPNWEIIALEPPRPINFLLDEEYGDIDIDPGRLWFSFYDYEDDEVRPSLIVYSELFNRDTRLLVQAAISRVIKNLLGERSAAIDIGSVDVWNLSNAPGDAKLHKIEDLPLHLGTRRSVLEIDATGTIREKRD